MTATSLLRPALTCAVLAAVLAALALTLGSAPAGATASTLRTAGVLAVLAAAVGLLLAFVGRLAPVLGIASAFITVVGHGVLLSPQMAAVGQPAIGLVGIVCGIVLVVAALEASIWALDERRGT